MLLIGCGAIGTVTAFHLVNHPSVHRLTLTDVDVQSARAVAERLGPNPKVRTQALDATDTKALERALKTSSVVIQASVPGNNARVQAACLATGTDYIDLAADSSDPYVASDEWERRDRIAIIGMGEDPGLSNLMARYSADRLDRVDSIRVRDGDSASSPDSVFLPLFSPETFIEETLNSSRIWENGKYREVIPFGEPEIYDFPAPVGPQKVYSVDHEEVDSFPRYIGKGVRYVDFKLAIDDTSVRVLEMLRDLRLLERGSPEAPGPREAILRALPKPGDFAGRIRGSSVLAVETSGEKDGKTRRETLYMTFGHRRANEIHHVTATAYLSGTPPALAAIQILDGTIRTPGLHPPESLDPTPFFRMLRQREIVVRSRVTVEHEVGR